MKDSFNPKNPMGKHIIGEEGNIFLHIPLAEYSSENIFANMKKKEEAQYQEVLSKWKEARKQLNTFH